MKTVIASTFLACMIAISPSASHAVLKISIKVDGSTFTCADSNACDTSPAEGLLVLQDQLAIGDLRFAQLSVSSEIAPTFNSNALKLSIPVINGLDITGVERQYSIVVSQTGFSGQVSKVKSSIEVLLESDTFGRSDDEPSSTLMDFKIYADTQNRQGADDADDAPGTNLGFLGFGVTGVSFPFSGSSEIAFVDNDLFSKTIHLSGIVADGGLIRDVSAMMLSTQIGPMIPPVSVPEPSSIFPILSAMGMMGLLAWRRKL
jgi:hypothetical protein